MAETNPIIDGLVEALKNSGTDYDEEKCRVVAESFYQVFDDLGDIKNLKSKGMEKARLGYDFGFDSLDAVELVIGLEGGLEIDIDKEKTDFIQGKGTSVLQVLQLVYDIKYKA